MNDIVHSCGGLSFSRLRYFWIQSRHFSFPTATEEVGIESSNTSSSRQFRLDNVGAGHRFDGLSGGRGRFLSAFHGLIDDVIQSLETPGTEDVAARLKEVRHC